MRRYRYQGFSREGAKVTGVLDASNVKEARGMLRSNGLTVQRLSDSGGESRRRFSLEVKRPFDTTAFFQELTVLTGASLTLDQALHVMKLAANCRETRDVIESMSVRLATGTAPSNAMQILEDLPEDLRALLSVGERSGRLPYAFSVIAEDLTRRKAQQKKMLAAAIYPLLLLFLMLGALLVVTFVLVPALLPIFDGSGRSPPLMIQVLSGLRDILSSSGFFALLSSTLLLLAILWMFKGHVIIRFFDSMLLRMPVIGPIRVKTTLARYLQSLALLIENSVSLPDALALSGDCCRVRFLRTGMLSMRDKVVSGRTLSDAMDECALFPAQVVSLVRAGDQVNKLSVVLANSSALLRDQATGRADTMLALMTPVVTIILGLLVGGLVISVMTALLSATELGIA